MEPASRPGATAVGNHFSCSMTAVLVARVAAFGGEPAVARLLREAGSPRSAEYLCDIANWISYDELLALGSVERVYEQITTTSTKYSVVTTLETVKSGPGFAEVVARAVDGFAPDPDICAWR